MNLINIKLRQRRIQMYFSTVWTVWVLKKCDQKVLVTFFLYIFHVKTKLNIVYEYLKTILKNIFKRHKYPSANALNIKYF